MHRNKRYMNVMFIKFLVNRGKGGSYTMLHKNFEFWLRFFLPPHPIAFFLNCYGCCRKKILTRHSTVTYNVNILKEDTHAHKNNNYKVCGIKNLFIQYKNKQTLCGLLGDISKLGYYADIRLCGNTSLIATIVPHCH